MIKGDLNVLRNTRLHSLLVYIMSAMLTKDIKELDTFDNMLPVIKKDLEKLPILIWPKSEPIGGLTRPTYRMFKEHYIKGTLKIEDIAKLKYEVSQLQQKKSNNRRKVWKDLKGSWQIDKSKGGRNKK